VKQTILPEGNFISSFFVFFSEQMVSLNVYFIMIFENDLSSYPEILTTLENKLIKFRKTVVPPGNKPLDPRGNPVYWDNTWANFGDYSM
jgi:hypothetical protein